MEKKPFNFKTAWVISMIVIAIILFFSTYNTYTTNREIRQKDTTIALQAMKLTNALLQIQADSIQNLRLQVMLTNCQVDNATLKAKDELQKIQSKNKDEECEEIMRNANNYNRILNNSDDANAVLLANLSRFDSYESKGWLDIQRQFSKESTSIDLRRREVLQSLSVKESTGTRQGQSIKSSVVKIRSE